MTPGKGKGRTFQTLGKQCEDPGTGPHALEKQLKEASCSLGWWRTRYPSSSCYDQITDVELSYTEHLRHRKDATERWLMLPQEIAILGPQLLPSAQGFYPPLADTMGQASWALLYQITRPLLALSPNRTFRTRERWDDVILLGKPHVGIHRGGLIPKARQSHHNSW